MSAYGLSRQQNVDLIVKTALEYGITDQRQIAYMLATAQHETGDFRTAKEDDGPRQAVKLNYSGGQDYYGRGYAQLTHDHRYAALDAALNLQGRLSSNPDLVAQDANLGAQTLVVGMSRGLFTGAPLHRYVGGDDADYENARRTINSTDRAALIAGYARDWESRLPAMVDRLQAQGITYRPLPGSTIAQDGVLRQGENGVEVHYVQAALNRLGYRDQDGGRLDTDGFFGGRTREAVMAFQQARGLEPSGDADQRTLRALGLHQYVRPRNGQQAIETDPLEPSIQRAGASGVADRVETRSSTAGTASSPFDDPRHPQHALHSEIKSVLPPETSAQRLSEFTAALHADGIRPGQLRSIDIGSGQAVFTAQTGRPPVIVDLNQNPPSLEESARRVDSADRIQASTERQATQMAELQR